jgi:hypothetical protein
LQVLTGVGIVDSCVFLTNTGVPHGNTGVPQTNTGVPQTNTGVPHGNTGVPHSETSARITGFMRIYTPLLRKVTCTAW